MPVGNARYDMTPHPLSDDTRVDIGRPGAVAKSDAPPDAALPDSSDVAKSDESDPGYIDGAIDPSVMTRRPA